MADAIVEHAVSAVREPPASARLDDSGPDAGEPAARARRVLPADERRASPSASRALAIVWWAGSGAWAVAAPFALAWIAAPAIARWTSLSPVVAGHVPVSDADARALRLVARRTWRYFETFVTAADHMLPPDNFQEDPKPVVAHRTSPTNIGPVPALGGQRARFRLGGNDRHRRAAGSDARDDARAAALPRPFLQLVRHARSAAAGAAVRLVGGQRQSRRPPDRSRQRLPRSGCAARSPVRKRFAGIEDAWISRAKPCMDFPTTGERRRSLGPSSTARWTRWPHALRRDPLLQHHEPPEDTLRAWGNSCSRPRPWSTSRGRWPASAVTTPAPKCCSGRKRRSGRSRVTAATSCRTPTPSAPWNSAWPRSKQRRGPWPPRWTSAFSSTRSASCCRSVTGSPKDSAIRAATTCSPPRRAWRASSPSPRATSPSRQWFRLGRAVTPIGLGAALISWSGSMFEYLMPSLVMRAPAGSLLEQTNRLVVRRQIAYGRQLGVPWGISESAYNVRDLELTYQYSNFGVPGLGLKRGLSENVVVAPYATALAAMVDPGAAARNFARLAAIGRAGTLRLLRGARLHALARARRSGRRDGARLHGAPPGHVDRGDRQRAPGREDAGAVSCRAHGQGDRAASARAHAARRRGGSSQGGGSRDGGAGPRPGAARGAADLLRAPCRAGGPPPVERPLQRHADGSGLRLQPLGRSRRSRAGARTPRATTGGATSSCATCKAARCGPPATSRAASSRTATRSPSPRIAPSSSGATERSPPPSRSSSRRKTTPRSAGYPS